MTSKGTEEHPIAKARLVARELNSKDKLGELFAGTPGLMSMRTVMSRATKRCENEARRSIMLADVKTAFLYGDARMPFFVELPPEDLFGSIWSIRRQAGSCSVWHSRRPDDLARPSPEDTN